jgi:hypothetical protein
MIIKSFYQSAREKGPNRSEGRARDDTALKIVYSRGMLAWRDIAALRVDDPLRHWEAARQHGLGAPFNVFVQLFHEPPVAVPKAVAGVDWFRVGWSEERLTGAELRGVYVDRLFQRAVDEARSVTVEEGLYDDRPEVVAAGIKSTRGSCLGSAHRHALLAGNTRLGNLLGLLDRREVAESQRHRVWLGRLLPP